MEIHLQPWGRLEVTVDASARNRAVDAPGSLRLDSQVFFSKPTEDGRFHFEFVPPGPLCVWLSAQQHIEDPTVPPYHHPTWVQVTAGETAQATITETGFRVKGRLVLSGRDSDSLEQPAYAILEGDLPADLANSTGLSTKQWMRSFFDLGRLTIRPDGKFESRNSLSPGNYRLLGKIGTVNLDQQIEVPNAQDDAFSSLGSGFGAVESPIIDVGNVVVVSKVSSEVKQR